MLEISRALTLSTAHIARDTAKGLDDRAYPGLIYFPKGEYGWFVWVSPTESEAQHDEIPADLAEAIKFARSHRVEWLILDRDGDKITELPTHDW